MIRHYHVLRGLAGCYMPDSNDVYTSLRSAENGLRYWRDDARECGDTVRGSIRGRYLALGEHDCAEITTCYEADCLADDNDSY